MSVLPQHWGTLYELTNLDDDIWAYALETGVIHPEMQRKDVRVLAKGGKPSTKLQRKQEKHTRKTVAPRSTNVPLKPARA